MISPAVVAANRLARRSSDWKCFGSADRSQQIKHKSPALEVDTGRFRKETGVPTERKSLKTDADARTW
jgi:hypothetical protein